MRLTFVRGLLLLALTPGGVAAETKAPPGFAVEKVADGLDPAAMAIAPDGRLFVTEKHGRVRIVKGGRLLDEPFHTFAVDNVNERGLLGVAFHPDYARNQRIYFYYTSPTPAPHNRISYIIDGGHDRSAGAETVVLDLTTLAKEGNHNGGALLFGADGKLYASTGENANGPNAQDPGNLLGKILRMNDDGSVPADNPFVNNPAFAGTSQLIYCLGVRNSYALALQPGTGRIFFNDVGAGRFEEIDEAKAGRNFGWPQTEGPFDPVKYADLSSPVFAYAHTEGKNSITGGAFYGAHKNGFPAAYAGKYFYADYAGNYVGVLDPSTGRNEDFITGVQSRPIHLTVGDDGVLYYIARGGMGGGSIPDNTASTGGSVWAVRYTGVMAPELTISKTTLNVPEGGSASFTVRLSRSPKEVVKVTAEKVSGVANLSISAGRLTLGPRAGTLPQTVRVTCAPDADSADGSALFTVTAVGMEPKAVRATCVDPDLGATIVSKASLSAIATVPYRYSVAVAGKPLPTVALRQGPPGMTLDAATGELRWTPKTTGVARVVVQARNGSGRDATQSFDVTVLPEDAPFGLSGRESVKPFLNMPEAAAGTMPVLLSQTGAFANTARLIPSPGLLPYDVNTPLWSDGASKLRFVAVPNDGPPYEAWEQVTFTATGEWTFPRGTVFVKHFELPTPKGEPGSAASRLETRLLVVDATGGVYGVTYKWRADGSDADLLPDALDESRAGALWSYPSRADCLVCHTRNAGFVLGVNTRQFNRAFDYVEGARHSEQLRTWDHIGMFAPGSFDDRSLEAYPKLAAITSTNADLATRVRSYLDANCASCHRPGGAPTPFDFRYETPLSRQGIVDGPVMSNLGRGAVRLVLSGDVLRSMLHVRMGAQDTSRMPPLARNTADQGALDAIAAWILALKH